MLCDKLTKKNKKKKNFADRKELNSNVSYAITATT